MADISHIEDKGLQLLRTKRDLAAQEQQMYGKQVLIQEKQAEIRRLETDLVNTENLVTKARAEMERIQAEIAAEDD